MKKFLLTVAVGILFFIAAVLYLAITSKPSEYKLADLTVGGEKFRAEIADTPSLRSKGLSGRDFLKPDAGMLFIFSSPSVQEFWMKDMKFPIDIIWIKNDKITGLVIGAEPEAGPEYTIYKSPEAVDKVLEINAGLSQKLGIKIGDVLKLN